MDQIFTQGIAAENIPGYIFAHNIWTNVLLLSPISLIAVAVYDQQIIWSKGYGSSNIYISAPPPTLDNM